MSTISVTLPQDGTTADVGDYNTPVTTIVNAINGGLDSTNISSLSGTKITAGTIPGSALDTTAIGGYITGLAAPNTVTALGNRSYSMVFNSVNYSTSLSAGMRLRTTRTVAAPTQCTSLNGTTQYYSKTSPAGMAQTDSITEYIHCKLTSYAQAGLISRSNGSTDGWNFYLASDGRVVLAGARAADDQVVSYQSVPLNKWVHITASINTTTTTGVITIDGVTVPSVYTNNANTGFAAPTQSYLIGALNGASPSSFFPGKIAQAASFSAVITPATILTYMSQTLAGAETSLISAYSFNNSINDLNANANNLTANGSAVATNADSPFGGQAGGTISSTLDYGIVQSVSFSTNTTVVVQVPEGCTIPTSGGVSSVVYSSNKAPYGMPVQKDKWRLASIVTGTLSTTSNATYGAFQSGGFALNIPLGAWDIGWMAGVFNTTTTGVSFNISPTALTGLTSAAGALTSRFSFASISPAAATVTSQVDIRVPQTLTAAQVFVMYTVGSTTGAGLDAGASTTEIFAENSLL